MSHQTELSNNYLVDSVSWITQDNNPDKLTLKELADCKHRSFNVKEKKKWLIDFLKQEGFHNHHLNINDYFLNTPLLITIKVVVFPDLEYFQLFTSYYSISGTQYIDIFDEDIYYSSYSKKRICELIKQKAVEAIQLAEC